MAWWVYKCNNRNHPYPNNYSDWRQFFAERAVGGRWGLTSVVPALAALQPGDMILAYQTDRNELVGLARMTKFVGQVVHLEAVEEFAVGVKVRQLKKALPAVAEIPAFKLGPKGTLNSISNADAQTVIAAAAHFPALPA